VPNFDPQGCPSLLAETAPVQNGGINIAGPIDALETAPHGPLNDIAISFERPPRLKFPLRRIKLTDFNLTAILFCVLVGCDPRDAQSA
jgi:hypothetical protein